MYRYKIEAAIQAMAVWIGCIYAAFHVVPLSFGSLLNTRIAHFESCGGAVLQHDAPAFRHFLSSGFLDTCLVPEQGFGPYRWMAWTAIIILAVIAVGFSIYSLVAGPVDSFGENIVASILIFCMIVAVVAAFIIWMMMIAMGIMVIAVIGIGFGATRD